MSNIKAFLLNTGYRVMGEVEGETDSAFEMKNVAAYTFGQGQEGMNVSFGAFTPEAVGDKLTLYKSQIVAAFEPESNMMNHYQTVFGQIVTPPSTLQLLN